MIVGHGGTSKYFALEKCNVSFHATFIQKAACICMLQDFSLVYMPSPRFLDL